MQITLENTNCNNKEHFYQMRENGEWNTSKIKSELSKRSRQGSCRHLNISQILDLDRCVKDKSGDIEFANLKGYKCSIEKH